MFTDDNLIPIAALQHYSFCERQCALIHIEQMWNENRLTVEGKQLHERVDEGGFENRRDLRREYHVPLVSYTLGLVGYADVVEYKLFKDSDGASRWLPSPVEHKRGIAKESDMDRVQLCAQALCLEEMMQVSISSGALFYGTPRKRMEVRFDATLRQTVRATVTKVHALFEQKIVPSVLYTPKCRNCSLLEACLPPRKTTKRQASHFLQRILKEIRGDEAIA